MKRSFATFAALTVLAALIPVVAIASCAAADTQITLTDFDAEGEQIYVAVEGESPREAFTAVRRGLSCNDSRAVNVDYELVSGTAGPPRISVAGGNNKGTLNLQAPPRSGTGSGFEATREFNVGAGGGDVGHATIRLQDVGEAGLDQVKLGYPRAAPVFVVDGDTTDTPFGFGMATYSRQETFTVGIPVFRSGNQLGAASVAFATSPGDDNPAGEDDYEVLTDSPLAFGTGERVKVIQIKMLEDFDNEGDEQFTVELEGQVSETAASTEVTIENLSPGSGALRPKGRLHHPKHKFKYPQNYPWLNEIHIFTKSADRDLTVNRAEMSITKKMKNGSCRWWTGTRFVRQRCIDRRWFSKRIKKPAKDYFLHRIKQKLPPSVGKKSKVARYEIRARWWDNRRNVSKLRVGANQNTFEVIKPSKGCRRSPYNSKRCKPVRP